MRPTWYAASAPGIGAVEFCIGTREEMNVALHGGRLLVARDNPTTGEVTVHDVSLDDLSDIAREVAKC